ncbi:MAG: potassium channel family protein [Thermomicrobiales bacterium]
MARQRQEARRRVAVIGLGRFGESAALALAELGYDVTAIDLDERKVADVADHVTLAAQANGTDESALRALAIDQSDVAIVGQGRDLEASVMITLILKRLDIPWVIAKAESELHGELLDRIGADRVVHPESSAGVRVAHSLLIRDIKDYLSLTRESGIARLPIQPDQIGRTVSDVCPPGCNLAVILIDRQGALIPSPGPGEILRAGDGLVVAGDDLAIEAFAQPAAPKVP